MALEDPSKTGPKKSPRYPTHEEFSHIAEDLSQYSFGDTDLWTERVSYGFSAPSEFSYQWEMTTIVHYRELKISLHTAGDSVSIKDRKDNRKDRNHGRLRVAQCSLAHSDLLEAIELAKKELILTPRNVEAFEGHCAEE